MKKIISVILVTFFAMALAVPAFAASSFDASTSQTDNTLTGDSPTTAKIPVYGYIGQNADISDSDPSNAAAAPVATANGTSINVTVPVKVMFAAFVEDEGEISSPSYTITNNSTTNFLTVSLASFQAKSTADNTAVDPSLDLSLNFNFDGAKEIQMLDDGKEVVTAPIELTNELYPQDNLIMRNTASFSFSGNYSGSFAKDFMPSYEMVLKFSLS